MPAMRAGPPSGEEDAPRHAARRGPASRVTVSSEKPIADGRSAFAHQLEADAAVRERGGGVAVELARSGRPAGLIEGARASLRGAAGGRGRALLRSPRKRAATGQRRNDDPRLRSRSRARSAPLTHAMPRESVCSATPFAVMPSLPRRASRPRRSRSIRSGTRSAAMTAEAPSIEAMSPSSTVGTVRRASPDGDVPFFGLKARFWPTALGLATGRKREYMRPHDGDGVCSSRTGSRSSGGEFPIRFVLLRDRRDGRAGSSARRRGRASGGSSGRSSTCSGPVSATTGWTGRPPEEPRRLIAGGYTLLSNPLETRAQCAHRDSGSASRPSSAGRAERMTASASVFGWTVIGRSSIAPAVAGSVSVARRERRHSAWRGGLRAEAFDHEVSPSSTCSSSSRACALRPRHDRPRCGPLETRAQNGGLERSPAQ